MRSFERGEATFEASPNIALVKYWGMRDVALGLPYNSSLSMTLERLRTRTTVRFDPQLHEDRLVLNGADSRGSALSAVSALLDRIRLRTQSTSRAEVRSRNNFPTASGLASSASGFAALAGAASLAGGLALTPWQLSELARFGSGSASRSIFAGFVEWHRGTRPDGRDCVARPLPGMGPWRALVDLVAIVKNAPTKVARSAEAMQRTVQTSSYYAERMRELPVRLTRMRAALRRRDPDSLFPLIIEECDSFRRACETTDPSLDYLTETSRAILDEIRRLNVTAGRPIAGYTHDAGAHVHVFTLQKNLPAVRRSLRRLPGLTALLALHSGPRAHRIPTRVH